MSDDNEPSPADADRFELHFKGDRFKGHRLPVSMLSDLSSYRELLVAFVQDIWTERNGGKRLTKKQLDSIELDLVGIEDGSANAVLKPVLPETSPMLPGMKTALGITIGLAKEKIYIFYKKAASGEFPEFLSAQAKSAVMGIGKSLPEEGHSIGIKDSSNDNEVMVTPEIRLAILNAVSTASMRTIRGIGRVAGIHEKGEIDVVSDTDGSFPMRLSEEEIEAKLRNRIKSDIVYEAEAKIDDKGKVSKVVEVHYAEVLTDSVRETMMRYAARIAGFKGPSLWSDEGGVPVSENARTSADELVRARPTVMDSFRISPTPAGGIMFETGRTGPDFFIEIMKDGSLLASADFLEDVEASAVGRDILKFVDNLGLDDSKLKEGE